MKYSFTILILCGLVLVLALSLVLKARAQELGYTYPKITVKETRGFLTYDDGFAHCVYAGNSLWCTAR